LANICGWKDDSVTNLPNLFFVSGILKQIKSSKGVDGGDMYPSTVFKDFIRNREIRFTIDMLPVVNPKNTKLD